MLFPLSERTVMFFWLENFSNVVYVTVSSKMKIHELVKIIFISIG